MAKDKLGVEAVLVAKTGGGMWKVRLGNDVEVLATLGSNFRSKKKGRKASGRPPWLIVGDRCLVSLSP